MIIANLALLPLPAPNSFATLTLQNKVLSYKVIIYICMASYYYSKIKRFLDIYPVPARKASGIIISNPFIDMLPMNIVQIVKK